MIKLFNLKGEYISDLKEIEIKMLEEYLKQQKQELNISKKTKINPQILADFKKYIKNYEKE